MIDPIIKQKFSKIYELVKGGATEGERTAAKAALERFIEKYKITADQLESINLNKYTFKYQTSLEEHLLCAILRVMAPEAFNRSFKRLYDPKLGRVKSIVSKMTYLDWVTVESAYEYFRRHMKKEWNKTCKPIIDHCKKLHVRNRRRKELEPVFLSRYFIASKLCFPEDITTKEIKSKKYMVNHIIMDDVMGGEFNTQLGRGLCLDNGPKMVQ